MKNFYRDTKPGAFKGGRKPEGRNFRGRGPIGSSSMGASMHRATCSACGKQCEVPFKPTGSRPIFCSMCFQKEGDSNHKRSNSMNSGRSMMSEKRSYKTDSNKYEGRNTDNTSEQFRVINTKLDAILEALDVR